jgi:hypothetical protein
MHSGELKDHGVSARNDTVGTEFLIASWIDGTEKKMQE